MNVRDFEKTTTYADLPLDVFNTQNISVYVLDFNWNYLFVNDFTTKNLGSRGMGLVGKNMWLTFPVLGADTVFNQLKDKTEKGLETNFITISPLTSQRINIAGRPLADCYLFSMSILPTKDDLMNDLRGQLNRGKHSSLAAD